jgi:hypothetical protein
MAILSKIHRSLVSTREERQRAVGENQYLFYFAFDHPELTGPADEEPVSPQNLSEGVILPGFPARRGVELNGVMRQR